MIDMINPTKGDKILDYGCGTGYMMSCIDLDSDCQVYGYDKNNYNRYVRNIQIKKSYSFQFDKIYFMHSIAHLRDVRSHLKNIRENFLKETGFIYILTPNKLWTDLVNKKDYIPDPTVVEHFCPGELDLILQDIGYHICFSGQLGDVKGMHNERIFIKATY